MNLSKRIGLISALMALPCVAQVVSGPVATQTTTEISPRQHGPLLVHGMLDDGTLQSENWSGFAVTGSSFTQAAGSWIVPAVNCNITPSTYSSYWVGIDGYSSNTVEQTGTDSDCNGSSSSYYAWYEFYPNPSELIHTIKVSPGNKMSAAVSYSGNEFTITITNETNGQSYTRTSRVPGAKRTSAEWIAEAPCCTRGGGILPLSDFGTASFGPDYTLVSGTNFATDSTTSGAINAFGSNIGQITMVSSKGVTEALP